ncbi:sensor histidine kinase [Bordetella genomosp. 4]|uniref:histidine kinase n=1 Tax=Bordetella genomosp. 4 TaxID=463044 RepID=A0A261U807_9BORD|nr:HAMP domain-containing sensor histidine kinase [Bordetella genomosp. 4]OZI51367.1 two-component sensor histidine kinase [Bordetella genomosp. 4]OZI57552.1 two-component sensor histidine kinase [Bordetella genomosp. 4]
MKSGTLTQRVIWALTGVVSIFVAVLALLAYLAFDQMEDGLVEQILTSEGNRIIQHLESDTNYAVPQESSELTGSIRAWLQQNDVPQSMPTPLRDLTPGLHELEPDDETWHVMVEDTARGRLYVLYDATAHEARVREFGLIVLGVGVLCIIAAYALSRRIAGVAVSPLLDLTTRLSDWAPGSPDLAITRDDEAGRLIEAFNRVQNQVDHSIAREREFAANLSHEVRTPLAAIRSDSEIMLLNSALPADPKERLTRIVANVDHIAASLESAHSMARDQPRPSEPVDLNGCMDDAWRGLEAIAEACDLVFRNHIPPETVRMLDKYALLTVLRNLVRNAIDHAAPATLTALLTVDGAIELRDTGKGIEASELPFLFERYYSGRLADASTSATDHGGLRHGLGLAIAKRVCDMQGWKLEVRSQRGGPQSGTSFTLRFG